MALALLLMRHAKATAADPTCSDHERPLNSRGEADALRMGRWLRTQCLSPALVLTSSAARAQQTARGVLAGLEAGVPVRTDPTLYLCDPSTMRAALGGLPDRISPVLLIGHNPGLLEWLQRLQPGCERFPTGSVAWVTTQASCWKPGGLVEGLELRAVWRPKHLG